MIMIDFLDKVMNYEVAKFEREDFFEKKTKGFRQDRLLDVIREVEFFIQMEKVEKESEYDLDKLSFPFGGFETKEDVPVTKRKNRLSKKDSIYYDLETLFFPTYLTPVYNLLEWLKSKEEKLNRLFSFVEYLEVNWKNTSKIKYSHIYSFAKFDNSLTVVEPVGDYKEWVRVNCSFTGSFDFDKPIPNDVENQLTQHLSDFDRISVAKTS